MIHVSNIQFARNSYYFDKFSGHKSTIEPSVVICILTSIVITVIHIVPCTIKCFKSLVVKAWCCTVCPLIL